MPDARAGAPRRGDASDPGAAHRAPCTASPLGPAGEPLVLRALRGAPVERPPIWLMRQAGRYLPEYRELRAAHDFLEMCRTPELATEVTLQPVRRFGLDAAILFSDILLLLDAMGAGLRFDGDGPVLERPLREPGDASALRAVDPDRDLPFVAAAVRQTVAALPPEVPLFGFAGAPFTLLTYLMAGRGERAQAAARALLISSPGLARDVLARLADAVTAQLEAQVRAGARAVQLFDTWAGTLPADLWRDFAAPAARTVFERLRPLGVPTIYFTRETSTVLRHLAEAGAAAYGIGWSCDLAEARATLGREVPVQGNLDPAVLLTDADLVRRRARQVIEAAGPRGHVFNLGHGVLPQTDPALVGALVEAVQGHAYDGEVP